MLRKLIISSLLRERCGCLLQLLEFPIQVEKKGSLICSRFFVSKFYANFSWNLNWCMVKCNRYFFPNYNIYYLNIYFIYIYLFLWKYAFRSSLDIYLMQCDIFPTWKLRFLSRNNLRYFLFCETRVDIYDVIQNGYTYSLNFTNITYVIKYKMSVDLGFPFQHFTRNEF